MEEQEIIQAVLQSEELPTLPVVASKLISLMSREETTLGDIANLVSRGGRIKRLFSYLFNKTAEPKIECVEEKFFQFDPQIVSLSSGVCLDGYWQSPKYFSDIETI